MAKSSEAWPVEVVGFEISDVTRGYQFYRPATGKWEGSPELSYKIKFTLVPRQPRDEADGQVQL